MNCLFVLALVGLAALVSAKDLPDKYYGKFDLDHSENFDEYLEAKGYGWFTRKLVTFATFKKEFTKSDKPGKFDYSNLTSKKDVHYKDVELGKEFVAEGLDSTKHKVYHIRLFTPSTTSLYWTVGRTADAIDCGLLILGQIYLCVHISDYIRPSRRQVV
ncbi:unnamed protein product [Cylicostephanus goldi]|uniref:Cytosolic fatty-acid binding proteins domain-containing protein n=1 Tax=Cylicostephanus goldi TaxID=71465 RepID=A0A3P6V2E4_CYLGO|nr:unnamed protein product [Cylicostephanus goldi]